MTQRLCTKRKKLFSLLHQMRIGITFSCGRLKKKKKTLLHAHLRKKKCLNNNNNIIISYSDSRILLDGRSEDEMDSLKSTVKLSYTLRLPIAT